MILPLLSASDFPYFSSFPKLGKEEGNRHIQNGKITRIAKEMIFTFDPASDRTLQEYIWTDHM
jgi:hypothetical protein